MLSTRIYVVNDTIRKYLRLLNKNNIIIIVYLITAYQSLRLSRHPIQNAGRESLAHDE